MHTRFRYSWGKSWAWCLSSPQSLKECNGVNVKLFFLILIDYTSGWGDWGKLEIAVTKSLAWIHKQSQWHGKCNEDTFPQGSTTSPPLVGNHTISAGVNSWTCGPARHHITFFFHPVDVRNKLTKSVPSRVDLVSTCDKYTVAPVLLRLCSDQ